MSTPAAPVAPAPEAPPAPPSTVKSAAIPISMADLKQELARSAPAAAPAPVNNGPTEAAPVPVEHNNLKPSSIREKMDAAMAAKRAAPKEEPAPKEIAPAPKTEAKPAAKTEVKAETENEVPEEHRRVLPHDKPDTAKRIKAILAERDAERQAKAALQSERDTAKAELEAAKKAGASSEEVAKLKEEYQKTQDDLLRYRRLHEIENDTEFKTKYREPVTQAEKVIEEKFKTHGFTEKTLETIKAEGGFAAFSRSRRAFPVVLDDKDNPGEKKTVYYTGAELFRSWTSAFPMADEEAVKAAINKQESLRGEEAEAKTKAQSEARAYFENQTKSQRESQEQSAAQQKKLSEEYENWAKETETKTDWLKDRELPADADEATKKEVTERNEFYKQLRDGLKKHPATPQEYGQLKLDAAEAHHLRRTLGDKDSRIAELEAELKKTRSATRTTAKAGSLLTGNNKAPEQEVERKSPTDWKSALDAKMKAGQGSIED